MSKQILVIAAHPDDEILGVGGAIARHVSHGDRVSIAIIANVGTTRYGGETVRIIQQCTRRAALQLSATIIEPAGFEDQKLDSIPILVITQWIEGVLEVVKPQIIYTHHRGDINRDHQIVYEATLTAARPYSTPYVEQILCYETPSSTEWGDRFKPTLFVDITEHLGDKLKAMAEYPTELYPFPHPRSLKALRNRAANWGSVIGVDAAEPFILIRGVKTRAKATPDTHDPFTSDEGANDISNDIEEMTNDDGQPTKRRKEFLAFALPDIDDTEITEVVDTLKSGWLTTGPKTRQFEAEFATAVGAKHAVAVNSCTAALHLALEAIGLQRGDEVITTTYTFAATAEVIRYFDAKPILVDINANDFNIDPEQVEASITSKTRAIIPVHIAGLPADLDAIYAIAARHGLAVIEDAAHAFPAKYKDRPIGSTTDPSRPSAICFSFYATKTLCTGEGGMICTDDDALAERCRIMSLHGISKDAWKRYTAEGSWYYQIEAPGYKYNMTDIAASMGLAQLRKADCMRQRRLEIAHQYNDAFATMSELQIPTDPARRQHAWHLYMLRLNPDMLNVRRAQFIQELTDLNIGVSVHFIPLHLHPYYHKFYGYRPADFPIANQEFERVVSLPVYSTMSDEDVFDVIHAVLEVIGKYRKSGYRATYTHPETVAA